MMLLHQMLKTLFLKRADMGRTMTSDRVNTVTFEMKYHTAADISSGGVCPGFSLTI
jgi:hypothetical protein